REKGFSEKSVRETRGSGGAKAPAVEAGSRYSLVASRLKRQATFEYQKLSGKNGPGRSLPSSPAMRCFGLTVTVSSRKSLPLKIPALIFVLREHGGPPCAIPHAR